MRGTGRVAFAGTMPLLVGTLNIIWRVIGIVAGTLGAIGALLSVGGEVARHRRPCVYIVHGIIVYGEVDDRPR